METTGLFKYLGKSQIGRPDITASFRRLPDPPEISSDTLQDYLARLFNHGRTSQTCFGWEIGDRDNVFRHATAERRGYSCLPKIPHRRASQRDAACWILPQERFGVAASDAGSIRSDRRLSA